MQSMYSFSVTCGVHPAPSCEFNKPVKSDSHKNSNIVDCLILLLFEHFPKFFR